LSIIDLETGQQPIHNENKSIWVVFNGEIYNFKELKKNLERKGHKFYTQSDTETIVHLYEDYGTDCVKYLRGMFAFAIWDERKRKLFLARDRMGQKPIIYLTFNNSLIFASEIKSILQVPEIKREIDFKALDYYLTYQYIPSPLTIFQGIKKLPPASILTCGENGQIKIERYWDLSFRSKVKMSEEEYSQRILGLLTEATRLRLISDVPLGAFLSGGIDSSAVVGLMSQLTSQPVKTFSIGFDEEDFSELDYARIIAKLFGTDHHEFIIKPRIVDILPQLIWHYDEPCADSSTIPVYYIAQETRKYVTIALSGDGGDESFAGYERYRAHKIASYYEKLPRFLREKIITKVLFHFPEPAKRKSLLRRLKHFSQAISLSPEERNIYWHSYFNKEEKNRLYSQEMKERVKNINSSDYLLEVYRKSDGKDFLDQTLFVDLMTYLPENILVKMDIATMAHSLEARSPFLDHKLMEFNATIPSNLKLRGLTSKYILKKALKELLPTKILKRGKMGFGVPIGKWFRKELKDYLREILLDKRSLSREYFKRKRIEELLAEHVSGKIDHGYRLWALLNLELWHRVFKVGR
ncbi:asparagine synthase (glutamine-hydrolyzing), partial [bacterium]|nr:asparagine synthase (glutamine-hydrolyzing) [bacterium]